MKNCDKMLLVCSMIKIKFLPVFTALILILLNFNLLSAENSDWRVDVLDNPSPGYLSFGWRQDSAQILMDNYGDFPFPKIKSGNLVPFKLLKNGLWISIDMNKVYLMNQDFVIVDSIPYPTEYIIDYHDINVLNNGHYMLLCIEKRIMDLSQIVEGGKTNATVLGAVLVETDRNGTIYWLWKSLDHYAVTDATPDVNLTNQMIDLTHANSFLEDTDGNFMISMRFFDEVSKINRSTGNLMWRLGGKFCKNNQFTFVNDTIDGFWGFSHQHSINRLANGNILLFDNGNLKDPQYSRTVEYQMNESAKTITRVWQYRPNPDNYVRSMGSARRLLNGNTLISFGSSFESLKILEVKPDNSIALQLQFIGDKSQSFFNADRYITKMDAVSKQINSKTGYNYNDGVNTTGIEIQVENLTGSGFTSVEKHNYAPADAEFGDSNFTSVIPMRWVFSKQNISSLSGILKINTDLIQNINFPDKVIVYSRSKESTGIFQPLNTSYNPDTKRISAPISGFGEFILVSLKLDKPTLFFPTNNQLRTPVNIKLKWNKLSTAYQYQIQISEAADMSNPIVNSFTSDSSLSYNLSNLDFSTQYFWRVRGINAKDTSQWSDKFKFTTIEDKIFTPELISPINNSEGIKNNDSLIWGAVPSTDYYILQISEDGVFFSGDQQTFEIINDYYIISDVRPFKKYYWRVKALNNIDTTDWSEVWCFTTNIDKPSLVVPKNNSMNNKIDGVIGWNEIAGEDKYQLQISINIEFENPVTDTIGIKGSLYDYSNFEFDIDYYWRVRAIRNSDTSEWSDIWKFHTLLPAPELIYPVQNQKGISTSAKVEWESEYPNAFYDVQISENSEFDNPIIDTNLISLKKFELQILGFNKLYFWRVRLSIGNKESNWSDTLYFTTEMESPEPLSPLNNEENVSINTKFIWNDKNLYNSYHLQISDDNQFSNIILDVENISNSEYSYPLSNSKTYYWHVKAESQDNFSQWTAISKFTTVPTTDVKENKSISDFRIFPNPVEDYITIQPSEVLETSEVSKVQIFNTLGIEIITTPYPLLAKEGNMRIDISQLQAGVYYIKIGNRVEKFVKM